MSLLKALSGIFKSDSPEIEAPKRTDKDEFLPADDVLLGNMNTNVTANSNNTRTVVIGKTFTAGVHNWKIVIEQTSERSSIMVGVITTETEKSVAKNFLSHQPKGWGYYAWDGSKYTNSVREDFSEKFTQGDVITVILDLNAATLEFEKNGKTCGIAYKGIKGPLRPAVSLQNIGDSVTYQKGTSLQDMRKSDSLYSNSLDGILVEGQKCMFKTYYGGYFCYLNHLPMVVKDVIPSCYFAVEKVNGLYKFKDTVTGEYMCTAQKTDVAFDVKVHQNGYSLCAGGKYLGSNQQGKVFIYANNSTMDTIFYPQKVDNTNYILKPMVQEQKVQPKVEIVYSPDKVYFVNMSQGSPMNILNGGSLISHNTEKTFSVISQVPLGSESSSYFEFKVLNAQGSDWICLGVTPYLREIPPVSKIGFNCIGMVKGEFGFAIDGQYYKDGTLCKENQGNQAKRYYMNDIVSLMIQNGDLFFFKNGGLIHQFKLYPNSKYYVGLTMWGKTPVVESVQPTLKFNCQSIFQNQPKQNNVNNSPTIDIQFNNGQISFNIGNTQGNTQGTSVKNLFKNGATVLLKTVWGTYFCYINNIPTAVKTPIASCRFKIQWEGEYCKFINPDGLTMVTGSINDVLMTIRPNQNGYSIFSGGKYLGITQDARALVYTDTLARETIFYPEFGDVEVGIKSIFKHGEWINLKTSWNTYFCYVNFNPTAVNQPSESTKFKVEWFGESIKFTDVNGAVMVTASHTDTMFTVRPNKGGYSLFAGGKYLGITQDRRALVYGDTSNIDTIFYPESPNSSTQKKTSGVGVIEDGKIVSFKTRWGTYVYYKDFKPNVSYSLLPETKFQIKQIGSKFQFVDPTGLNLVAASGDDNTFTVIEHYQSHINGYSLLSDQGSYLGVSQDGRVLLYKSYTPTETRFYPVISTTTQTQNTVQKKENIKRNVFSLGLFRDGEAIALKSKHGSYFYYDDQNEPKVTYTKNEHCQFIVEQHGDRFKLRTINFSYACTTQANFTLFKITEYNNPQQNGYSLFSGDRFLGVSLAGDVLCYKDDSSWDTRFFAEQYVLDKKETLETNDHSQSLAIDDEYIGKWKIPDGLLEKNNWKTQGDIEILELSSSDYEYKNVTQMFKKYTKRNFNITKIMCINNEQLSTLFGHRLDNLATRLKKPIFQPKWDNEKNVPQRKKYLEKMHNLAIEQYKGVSIIPVFHGCRKQVVFEICETGFANLKTTDMGYFGAGIYGTPHAEYAATVYGDGVVILCYMSVGQAYPVVDGDMEKLMGKSNYANFDAHYIPVVPKNPQLHAMGKEAVYFPCKPEMQPVYDEFVVFQESQIVPRYIIYYDK